MSKSKKTLAVVVTTKHRGVFFGYINPNDKERQDKVEVEDLQMAVYWSADIGGVLGLPAVGPSKTCRISKPAKSGVLHDITAVIEATSEAEKAWKKCPWG